MIPIRKIITVFILTSLVLPTFISAEIYKWRDKNGVLHYSETKPEQVQAEEFKVKSFKNVVIEDNSDYIETENEAGETNRKQIRRNKKVIMYSTEWCGYCKLAKLYFKKNNIRYTDYDIEKSQSARKRFEKLGGKGVPLILVGRKRMSGFDVSGFKKIYES